MLSSIEEGRFFANFGIDYAYGLQMPAAHPRTKIDRVPPPCMSLCDEKTVRRYHKMKYPEVSH